MDEVKTDRKKGAGDRLERRKKWWAEKKGNARVTRARATEKEDKQSSESAMLATTSSRGFTSAHNSTITSNSSKQKQLKTNTANLQNSVQGAKSHKKKIKAGANKNKSNDKIEKPKEKAQSVEKSSPPESHGVRSFNTAETEMTPSVHSPKKYVLFVGNLPYSVTKEQVEDHFRKTGGVKAVRIPKEKGTEKSKGFAYIEFNSTISHRIALRLHNTTLGGRKINVEFTSSGGKNESRMQKLKSKNEKLAKFKMPFDT